STERRHFTPRTPDPSDRGIGRCRFRSIHRDYLHFDSPSSRRCVVIPPGKKGTAMKMKLAIVALLLGSARGSVWPAAKYKRRQDIKVEVKLSEKAKPIQPKTQDKSEFKPELTADAVLSIEGLVSNIRNEQEQILAQLIDQTPDSEVEEKSDYYFRLGELYAKQQRLFRLKAAEAAIQVDKAKTPQAKQQAQNAANKAAETAKQYLLN